MKILFILDSPAAWESGIWFYRNHTPSIGLKKRGHAVKFVALGGIMPENLLDWPDTVIFGRTYPIGFDPIGLMRDYKEAGKRVLYDIDDDLWAVNEENPSAIVSSAYKDQYEGMIKECDAITTPSQILGKKIQKLTKKPVFICNNAINYDYFHKRQREHKELIIGYAGASSHWKDLSVCIEALVELRKKHQFKFAIFGMTSAPLEAEMYRYHQILTRGLKPEKEEYFRAALDWYQKAKNIDLIHIPFYPPELFPSALSRADFDIGLCPLADNEFNHGKSCHKFYEYAAVGTTVLASHVLPYKTEISYTAKNTKKDWVKKLEKLITDKDFREELGRKQAAWVEDNREMIQIALEWELACQKPGGLKVRRQQKK